MSPTPTLEHTLPASVDAERSILGSILCDNLAYTQAAESLTPDDFSLDSHRRIYRAILELAEQNKPIDQVTLTEALLRKKELEAVGGVPYLSTLIDYGLPENIEQYVQIVRDKSILRDLVHSANGTLAHAMDESSPAEDVLAAAESSLYAISERQVKRGFASMEEVFRAEYGNLDRFYAPGARDGLITGYTELDMLTGGFQKQDLVIIAGRPSMGKTALAMNFAEKVALRGGVVGVFSLEMSRVGLLNRMACSMARVPADYLRSGVMNVSQRREMDNALAKLFESALFVDDTPAATITQMRAKARRLKHQHKGKLDLIIVDYIQLMGSTGKVENRTQEVTAFSKGLKNMAKELECPVIALSQLNRAPERGGDHRPNLSDLRESGAIEQDADVVGFVYREEYYHPDDPQVKGKAELLIKKHRNGATDTIKLSWIPQFVRFENYTPEAQP